MYNRVYEGCLSGRKKSLVSLAYILFAKRSNDSEAHLQICVALIRYKKYIEERDLGERNEEKSFWKRFVGGAGHHDGSIHVGRLREGRDGESAFRNRERAEQCTTLPVWKKLDEIINDYLESVNLADLAGCPDGGDNYVI